MSEYNEKDHVIFLFENGKGVRIPVKNYETKTNRRKLTGAFSDASPVVAIVYESVPTDLFIENSAGKGILINSSLIPEKATRTSAGVTLFNMKDGIKITNVSWGEGIDADKAGRCRKNKIPATGISIEKNGGEQLRMDS